MTLLKQYPNDPAPLTILIQKLHSMMSHPMMRPFSAVLELLVHVIRDLYNRIAALERRSERDP